MGWHCKASGYYWSNTPVFHYPDADGLENCDQIYYILRNQGWTTNAICGLITCIAFESGYNPWKWQGSIIPTTSNYNGATGNKGYGLVQWDPGSYENYDDTPLHQNKYIDNPNSINIPGYGPNLADQTGSLYDGYAQMIFLDTHGSDQNDYYNSHNYYGNLCPTYASYKASTYPAEYLCETWTQNFERAQGTYDPDTRTKRQALAVELWNYYNGKPVLPPDTPGGGGSFPVWLLFKMKDNNFGKGGLL